MNTKLQYPPDPFLMTLIFTLTGVGLVANYSSSAIYALDKFGSSTYFLWRHLIWIFLGLAAASFFTVYDHRKLKGWVKPLLLLTLILLVSVLFFGREVGGAKRWLKLGGFGFQPSELAKIVIILFVAYYCDKRRSKLNQLSKGILPLLIVISLLAGLIFVQPDFGTPVLIGLTTISLLLISGLEWKYLGALAAVGTPLAMIAAWAEPYRRRRILAFLNPWENAQGSSYQLVQSLLALGSGGLTGTGLGNSRLKLLYLPEPHTDFVFPIFAEETGLLGSFLILLLFGSLAQTGFRIAGKSKDLFSSLLASGITLSILYQAILNIAMVSGCIPTKGLPLPFLSFGGSSLLMTLSSMGILLNISRYAK
ncbi:MAG: putative lipid II flippase FtsW [Elusimicrobia bacterium]|nr:putative lipid II flippase FtsW [Elusimicrobiota bacterium]MBI2916271.1 putative lipid II flippase FtsW [Elusimicrobiota bacterium]MBI3012799.1 putative lipid II flippase FtsW [Elusimicrobiota bacterium]